MDKTTNYNLNKPAPEDFYNVQDSNDNMDIIDAAIKDVEDKADQAFTQADNGKKTIKSAIVGKDPDITIPSDATFGDLADAINQIETGISTDDATATVGDILSGKTAYAKGQKITGNIPSKGAQTYTPGTANQTIGAKQYLSGAQTILGDANLVPGNILAGVSIFGVFGSMIAGKRFQTGTVSTGERLDFYDDGINVVKGYALEVSTNFKPSIIIAYGVFTNTVNGNLTNNMCYALYQSALNPIRNRVFYFEIGGYDGSHAVAQTYAIGASAYVDNSGFCIPVRYNFPSGTPGKQGSRTTLQYIAIE